MKQKEEVKRRENDNNHTITTTKEARGKIPRMRAMNSLIHKQLMQLQNKTVKPLMTQISSDQEASTHLILRALLQGLVKVQRRAKRKLSK